MSRISPEHPHICRVAFLSLPQPSRHSTRLTVLVCAGKPTRETLQPTTRRPLRRSHRPSCRLLIPHSPNQSPTHTPTDGEQRPRRRRILFLSRLIRIHRLPTSVVPGIGDFASPRAPDFPSLLTADCRPI